MEKMNRMDEREREREWEGIDRRKKQIATLNIDHPTNREQ